MRKQNKMTSMRFHTAGLALIALMPACAPNPDTTKIPHA
jgi:hypothetical protein